MKYTISINQAGIADAGLHTETNLSDWAILEYIKDWTLNPRATQHSNAVWINYQHMMTQMPLLGIRDKGAISRRLRKLESLGLLKLEKDASQRTYARLTTRYHDVTGFRVTVDETHPPLTKNNGAVDEKQRGTVDECQHTVDNHTSSDNQDKAGPDEPGLFPGEGNIGKHPKYRNPVTIDRYLEDCEARKVKPIPPDDAVFAFAKEVKLPKGYLRLAWEEFQDRMYDRQKRYKDWRGAFRNCAKENWFRLWWIDADGAYQLTTLGRQVEKKLKASAG